LRALAGELDVRVFTPLHGRARSRMSEPPERVATVRIPHPAGEIPGEVLATTHQGVPFYFVSSPLFDEQSPVYHLDTGWDAHRFTFFSLASLAAARAIGFLPDVVHANDWHTAPAIAAIHRARFADPVLGRARTVLTVHNLPYLGHGGGPVMRAFGLVPGELPLVPPAVRELPLPIGLALADRITTVSPGYAREILTGEHGAGLDTLLRARREVLVGILNGIDPEDWDPARDPALVATFDSERLEARLVNKTALQRELALPERLDVPLLALVSRLSHQKGIDLVPDALRLLVTDHEFQAVLLGTGDRDLEDRLLRLADELRDRVRVRIGFDEALARRIYAGADILMLPSRYEPCGLVQMIAMRYGCVPVARDTGGFSDTVRDLDLHDDPTGFLFPVASACSLAFGLRRAIATFTRTERFRMLRVNGMRMDFSWRRAATLYARSYEELKGGANRA
jgi:starch synthase